MLVPIYLGLCQASDLDKVHEAVGALINANLGMAVLVSPLCRDGCGRRLLGVASLPLPGSQVRVAELVQSGCNLGLQSCLGGGAVAYDQPRGPILKRIAIAMPSSK
jgi:hypothetical protein